MNVVTKIAILLEAARQDAAEAFSLPGDAAFTAYHSANRRAQRCRRALRRLGAVA